MNVMTLVELKELIEPYVTKHLQASVSDTSNFAFYFALAALGIGLIILFLSLNSESAGLVLLGVTSAIIGGIIFLNSYSGLSNSEVTYYNITDYLELETQKEDIELATTLRSSDVLNKVGESVNVLTEDGLLNIVLPKEASFVPESKNAIGVKYIKVLAAKNDVIPQSVIDSLKDKKIEMTAVKVYIDPSNGDSIQQNINISANDNANVNIDNNVKVGK